MEDEELILEIFAECFEENNTGEIVNEKKIKKFIYKSILEATQETSSVSMKIKGFQSLFREGFGKEIFANTKIDKEEEEIASLPFDINIQKERM